MGCCGSGQRTQKNKAKKAAVPPPVSVQQKGIALKVATQVAAQTAAMIKLNPHLIQNRAM